MWYAGFGELCSFRKEWDVDGGRGVQTSRQGKTRATVQHKRASSQEAAGRMAFAGEAAGQEQEADVSDSRTQSLTVHAQCTGAYIRLMFLYKRPWSS